MGQMTVTAKIQISVSDDEKTLLDNTMSVSYTHLDVYKRQSLYHRLA